MTWVKLPLQEQWQNANDVNAAGYVLKTYLAGTTTPTPMAIDQNGSTTVSTVTLNADGIPEVSGNEVVLYIDRDFRFAIYENASDAAADTNAFHGPVDVYNVLTGLLTAVDSYTTLDAIAAQSTGTVVTTTDSGISGDWVVDDGAHTANVGYIRDFSNAVGNQYLRRLYNNNIVLDTFGAAGDGVADDTAAIQAAIDYAATLVNTSNAVTVSATTGRKYLIASGLVIPPRVILDMRGNLITYSGTGDAVTLGNSDSVLSPYAEFINFSLHLSDKTAVGVRLRGTKAARVIGKVEGLYQPFDNTRTNIGVEVDGVNISSFYNHIDVECLHIHEGFRLHSTGTVQPTSQFFVNCKVLGDQSTDNTSIGYNFVDSTPLGLGDGTKIIGGNIEACNTGIYFGSNSRGISVDTRFEILSSSTSRIAKYHANAEPSFIKGSGIDLANIGAVALGLEGFGNAAHIAIDSTGNTRNGGNDSSFVSTVPPTFAFGQKTLLLKSNEASNIRTTDTSTGTGSIFMQPGGSSSTYGAYLRLNAHSNATKPGDCEIGYSNGAGSFRVTSGSNQQTRFEVTSSAALPGLDNSSSCGTASKRWTVVYAVSGTINTSDERAKTEIAPIDDKVLDAWADVDYCQYKFIASCEEKGPEKARVHFGLIAQNVMRVFAEHGLDPFRYGLLCFDEWEESSSYRDVEDEVGNVIETVKDVFPGGQRFGLRYEQCAILELALMRREMKDIIKKKKR